VVRSDTGNGMSPQARRLLILRKKNGSNRLFAFFIAVHAKRGANWRLYASQANDITPEYRQTAEYFNISIRQGDKGVTSQVIANAFADCLIFYRTQKPLTISGLSYNKKSLPQKYQFVGSLGSMYHADEDQKDHDAEALWLVKTLSYISFMRWYVSETSKLTQRKRSDDKGSIARRILKGAHFAWGSWTIETRKAWSDGNFKIEPKSPSDRYAPLSEEVIEQIILDNTWND